MVLSIPLLVGPVPRLDEAKAGMGVLPLDEGDELEPGLTLTEVPPDRLGVIGLPDVQQSAHAAVHVRRPERRAADLQAIEIPLRLPIQPGDWPAVVTISIDDRPADRVVMSEDGWQTRRVLLPPRGSRRRRRIDIHVDRTRPGNRGVVVGEIVRKP